MINLEIGGWNVTVNKSFKTYSTSLGGFRDIPFIMSTKILINFATHQLSTTILKKLYEVEFILEFLAIPWGEHET